MNTALLQDALDRATVEDEVFVLRPDYRVMLLALDAIAPGPSDQASEALLEEAEAAAREALGDRPAEELPHVAAWREAYRHRGAPRLVRATGEEDFGTVADGDEVIERPVPGEVVWRDDAGVTCRRWNWRQAGRTHLGDDTTTALFIFEALEPMTDAALTAAADDLVTHVTRLGPDVRVVRRLIAPSDGGG